MQSIIFPSIAINANSQQLSFIPLDFLGGARRSKGIKDLVS
ncbi:MAG: hypothetical protein AB4206_17275 [Xenococcaceae cyanobacterium]